MPLISFCTVCMSSGDLALLQQTLLQNIQHNNAEFVIIDCSEDGEIKNWIFENTDTTHLNYFAADCSTVSLAKNMAIEHARGEIICNINPWEFIGQDFTSYVQEIFAANKNILLSTPPVLLPAISNDYPPLTFLGKLCVRKKDLLKGYNERIIKFGHEDLELADRLCRQGLERKWITDPAFCNYVDCIIGKDLSFRKISNALARIYTKYCTPSMSDIIFLYRDGWFEKGTLINHATLSSSDYSYATLKKNVDPKFTFEGITTRGYWSENLIENSITLHPHIILRSYYKSRYDVLQSAADQSLYYLMQSPTVIDLCLAINHSCFNTTVV